MSYRFWEKIKLFKHGDMTNPDYAIDVFTNHFERVDFANKNNNFVALEIGPGDSVSSAIIAHGFGASKCYMVDVGRFASEETSSYRKLVKRLNEKKHLVDDFTDCDFNEMIESYGGVYLTDGLDSLKKIPDGSVDFIWSQAVLEHIGLYEFDELMQELRRIIRSDGCCSHRVDLKDHLSGALNNLRFSENIWESTWMKKSGFYTNRIRFKNMISRFRKSGFSDEIVHIDRWSKLPISRSKLAKEFAGLDDDLLVSGFDIILRPA